MEIRVRKMILFLLIAIVMLSIGSQVKATTSYGVELISNTTTVEQGQEIEITIKVKDIIDISGGVAGLSAKLEYDTTKLEKVGEGQSLNGFMLVEGDTIELAKYPGIVTDTEIAKFTFKAKNNATGEAQIKLTGVEVANGADTFALGKEVTKTILITSPGTPTEQLSSNNNLSSLSVDGTQISNFNKDTLTYTLTAVENSKSSIKITAEAEDAKAKITGTGTKNLSVGKNSFNIVVTAEDGTQKKYVVTVERKATSTNKDVKNESDDTKATTTLPKTGTSILIVCSIGIVIIITMISFVKIKKLSGIK